MTSTYAAPVGRGRHRLGRPGLIPVTTLVAVVRRGFFAALFRAGKHRYVYEQPATMPSPAPAHAI